MKIYSLVVLGALTACARSEKASEPAPSPEHLARSAERATSTPPSSLEEGGTERAIEIAAPKDADALTTIRTERLRAKAAGRTLVVFAGASWCEPCRMFHRAVAEGALAKSLAAFTFLEFDADADQERLAAIGYAYKEIPYFALPGADGTKSAAFSPVPKRDTVLSDIEKTLLSWSGPHLAR